MKREGDIYIYRGYEIIDILPNKVAGRILKNWVLEAKKQGDKEMNHFKQAVLNDSYESFSSFISNIFIFRNSKEGIEYWSKICGRANEEQEEAERRFRFYN